MDCIFVQDIFNPSLDKTLPTNSSYLIALGYRLSFLNRPITDRNRKMNSILVSPNTLQSSIFISRIT